jgi:hypothetical protein
MRTVYLVTFSAHFVLANSHLAAITLDKCALLLRAIEGCVQHQLGGVSKCLQ